MNGHPATAEDLFAFLDAHQLDHSTCRHPPTFRVSDGHEVQNALPGGHTKNLFLRDAKGRLWLVSALADSVIDLRSLPSRIGAARLSFGSEERLWKALGVRPGSVSPLALINDHERTVTVVLERALLAEDPVNFHPLSNDATTSLATKDFLKFLQVLGYDPIEIEFSRPG